MNLLLGFVVLSILSNSSEANVNTWQQVACPEECVCPPNSEINCNERHLSEVPPVDTVDNDITSFDLSHNNIKRIRAMAFETLGQMKYLDLRSNGLRRIDRLGFNGLDNVLQIRLDKNNLTSLHKGLFHLTPSLQTLTLSRNPLDVSISIPFSVPLYELDISHCQLRTIPPDFLAGVKYLQELDLTHNSLESLPVDFLFNLPKLKRVHLHGNPWRCDVMEDLLLSKQDVIADFNKVHCVTSDGEQRESSWKQTQTTRVPSTSIETETWSQGARATRVTIVDKDISVSSTVIVYIYGAVICIILITCVVVVFLLRLSIMDCFNKFHDRTSTVDLRGSGESSRSYSEPIYDSIDYDSIVDVKNSKLGDHKGSLPRKHGVPGNVILKLLGERLSIV